MTPSVNTLALVTLMRNAIWRERVDICYQFTQTLKNKINAIEHFLYVESFRKDHYRCAIRWNNSGISHRLGSGRGGGGGGWGREKACRTKTWQCGRKVRDHLWKPRKAKKIFFEKVFSHNDKINALTEVKEHQHLTASGIKSLQKQTAGNNCLVYALLTLLILMLDSKRKKLDLLSQKKEKPLMLFIES